MLQLSTIKLCKSAQATTRTYFERRFMTNGHFESTFSTYAFGRGGGGHKKEYAVYARENDDNYGRPLNILFSLSATLWQMSRYVDSWWRRVCRVGRLLLPLLPLYSFMHRSILLSSSHSCLYDCSPVPTNICGCLPCRSVDSRHFHIAQLTHDHLRLPPMS